MRTLERGYSRAAQVACVTAAFLAAGIVAPFPAAQAQYPTSTTTTVTPATASAAPAVSTDATSQGTTQPEPTTQLSTGDPYPSSLNFGTGLIDDPVAWVSPSSGDFWLSYGAKRIPSQKVTTGALRYWNGNVAIDTHWLQRVAVGLSIYDNNPDWGFFGQLLALRDGEFSSLLPAVAVGFRNLGPDNHEERFLIGHDVTVDSAGHTHSIVPFYFQKFHTAPTFYAVATKNIAFHSAALSSVSLTIGGGNGLFSDDGGLGKAYNKSGTIVKGMFFGIRTVSHPSETTTISLVAENNGWDYNAGIVGGWRGLSLGFYGSELDKGSTRTASSLNIYNYRKWSVSFSYNGNFGDVGRGHLLRTEITALEHEQRQLHAEIARRERNIADLETRLARLQRGEMGDVTKQREAIEKELEQEREAIRRANERLKQLQGEKPQ